MKSRPISRQGLAALIARGHGVMFKVKKGMVFVREVDGSPDGCGDVFCVGTVDEFVNAIQKRRVVQ